MFRLTNPTAIKLSDAEVKSKVMADLKGIMGITAEPEFVRIFRHEKAIPQYTVGHGQRLLALEERLSQTPGLFLTGNAFFGIGLNDCVHAANQTADRVLAFLGQGSS
ncbi:MAG: FAD-dependent oxidoreductase [Desulfuromonadaceae bacterium]